jgi:hypothetical protein
MQLQLFLRYKTLIDKYVEVWNTGNMNQLDDVMNANFIRLAESSSDDGLDNFKKLITESRISFPDLN